MRVLCAFMSAGCFCLLHIQGAYATDNSVQSHASAAHSIPAGSSPMMMMPAAPPVGVAGARALKPGQVMLG